MLNQSADPMNFDGAVFKITHHNEEYFEIAVGDKIAWSPVGSGVLTDINDRGYPRVNNVAVTSLVTEKGFVYGDLRSTVLNQAKKSNVEVNFSYLVENVYFSEGTGPYVDVKFGNSATIHDVGVLNWKISYLKSEKTEQQIKDDKRIKHSLEIATPAVEGILNNKELSDEQKKYQLIQLTASWIQAAAQHLDNELFYHGIVTQIGEMFGQEAKTSDDGSVQDDVLALKVPELVKNAVQNSNELKRLMSCIGTVTLS